MPKSVRPPSALRFGPYSSPVRTAASVDALRRPRCRTAVAELSETPKRNPFRFDFGRRVRSFEGGFLPLGDIFRRPRTAELGLPFRKRLGHPRPDPRALSLPIRDFDLRLPPGRGLRLASAPCGASAHRATSTEPTATTGSHLRLTFGRTSLFRASGPRWRGTPSGVLAPHGLCRPSGAATPKSRNPLRVRFRPAISLFEGMAPVGGSALRRSAVSRDGRCGDSLLEEQLLTDRCLLGIRPFCVPLRVDLAL